MQIYDSYRHGVQKNTPNIQKPSALKPGADLGNSLITLHDGTNVAAGQIKSENMEFTGKEDKVTERNIENKTDIHMPVSHENPMQIPLITQITPENEASSGEKIIPTGKTESPSQQELEQDVVATNPSVESMQSRG